MKRFLALMAFCAVVDFLTPDAQVHAQVMIAPAVLAAIIGAVGSLLGGALGGKPKNEGIDLQKGKFEPYGREGSSGTAALSGSDMVLPGKQSPMAPLLAPDGGGGMGGMRGPSTQPPDQMTPKYNEKIAGADVGEQTMFRPLTGPPPQRQTGGFDLGLTGGDAGGTSSGNEGFNLGKVDLSGGESSTKKGFDADKTLQYAAMAATIGSLLNSGGPPRPPALPGGGGFNAQPTSMRFLYGG